jgi:hypothetical protein
MKLKSYKHHQKIYKHYQNSFWLWLPIVSQISKQEILTKMKLLLIYQAQPQALFTKIYFISEVAKPNQS